MQIGIYGLGRFGGFWAGCVAQHTQARVVAYSRNDHELPKGVERGSEEEVLHSDILFFCVSISSFEAVLERVKGHILPSTIVLDTCSVKAYPASWMKEKLGSIGCPLIASHPMFGPDSAKNGVKDLPLVLCPLSVEEATFEKMKSFFKAWGLQVIIMTPEEHDKEAAYSQGITHFIGRTLKQLNVEATPIGTKGFRSLLTIMEQTCNDPLQLFYDLQHFNPYTKEMRLELKEAFEKVEERLEGQEIG